MSDKLVSFTEAEEHYDIYRWRIERALSNWFHRMSIRIATSQLDMRDQFVLVNTSWAVAAFARAHNVLVSSVRRVERALNDGVPAAIRYVTGPYDASAEVLFFTALWTDLADTVVWYRTIADRLVHLKSGIRASRVAITLTSWSPN